MELGREGTQGQEILGEKLEKACESEGSGGCSREEREKVREFGDPELTRSKPLR